MPLVFFGLNNSRRPLCNRLGTTTAEHHTDMQQATPRLVCTAHRPKLLSLQQKQPPHPTAPPTCIWTPGRPAAPAAAAAAARAARGLPGTTLSAPSALQRAERRAPAGGPVVEAWRTQRRN